MLQKLRDRITRWLFGPPPREEYTIRYVNGQWLAYDDRGVVGSSPDKRKLEAWLDMQDNREARNG